MQQWDDIKDAYKSFSEDRVTPPSSVKSKLHASIQKERRKRFFFFGSITVIAVLVGSSVIWYLSGNNTQFITENGLNETQKVVLTEQKLNDQQDIRINEIDDSVSESVATSEDEAVLQSNLSQPTRAEKSEQARKSTTLGSSKENSALNKLQNTSMETVSNNEEDVFELNSNPDKPRVFKANAEISNENAKMNRLNTQLNITDVQNEEDGFEFVKSEAEQKVEKETNEGLATVNPEDTVHKESAEQTVPKTDDNSSLTAEDNSLSSTDSTFSSESIAPAAEPVESAALEIDSTSQDSVAIPYPEEESKKTKAWSPFIGLGGGVAINQLVNPAENNVFPEFGFYGGYSSRNWDFELGVTYTQMQSKSNMAVQEFRDVLTLTTQEVIDSTFLMYEYIFDSVLTVIDSFPLYEFDTTQVTFYDTSQVSTTAIRSVYFRSNVFSIPLNFQYYFNFGKFNLGLGAQVRPSFMTLINTSTSETFSKIYQFQLQVAPIASVRYDVTSKWSILVQGGYGFGLTTLYFDERLSSTTKWNSGFAKLKLRYYFGK